ncbi:adenylate kinase [Candidatus Pacearchaeota archaeon]|nr:adenylate kinase [Candidatus Pacearchaeota archaeon]
MKMIFLGPPAVGKGTHAGKIAAHFKIPKISTGEILRDEIKNNTDLGKTAKEYMDKGDLVPDEIVIGMLKNKLEADENKDGYILDGFPRTIDQAKALDELAKIEVVVNMKASHETIIERISNRITCTKCQAIFNLKFVKPQKEGICDKCGAELYQREDQKPEVVKERLEVYDRKTAPLVDFYKDKGIEIDVQCDGEVDEVHKRILSAIQDYLAKKS